MRLFKNIEKAVFLSRPNRFTIICDLEGKKVKAYLANPGRLWELLLPGVSLHVEKTNSPELKLPYRVVAVEKNGQPVVIHTHKINDAARFLLEKGLVPGLEEAVVVKKEVKKGCSRFDFLLQKGSLDIFLEVKSCTLFTDKVAMFPDAPTSRGKRHVDELARISSNKIKGVVLFLINSFETEVFLPDYHTDLNFVKSLCSARGKIMIIPLAIRWREDLSLTSKIRLLKVPWKVLEREAKDGGSYLVVLRLSKKKCVETGALGKINFKRGFYLYVGSAKKNLSARMERHKRLRKKLFWHIDYFREVAEICTLIPIRSKDDLECEIAKALKEISDWNVPNFGSSDCSCGSHLFGMHKNPISSVKFQNFLQYFRMGRLTKLI